MSPAINIDIDNTGGNAPNETWAGLSTKKIYFGHQSVGFNMIDGIRDVIKEKPGLELNIVESYDGDSFKKPVFAHSRIGQNQNPHSKIQSFKQYVENGIGVSADMAFFKLCYVDVQAKTDIEALFKDYRDILLKLKDKYPNTLFIHFTVPVTVVQVGVKAVIKKLIGREIGGYDANIRRNQFNVLLKQEYEGKEPVFDIADIESTPPDGRLACFKVEGKSYRRLVPSYSSDGRHLNEHGRRVVARKLLSFLSTLESSV